ncbi:hypothetical protein HUT16_27585 [Kitasatospora sp. NA04385]|uniref:hypothetical protein n=1 Tax=Kitasatospora sp. NA04385 TaxID=2742135 RepID=UPI0015920FDE|nr:hypothetical protein [Kitasatospora sp. NA04385]QKW22343.1 hypothetical protein HUT16_27585 [Kitasatospora sp. NA04385]
MRVDEADAAAMVSNLDGAATVVAVFGGKGGIGLRWCRTRAVRRTEQAQNENKQAILLRWCRNEKVQRD